MPILALGKDGHLKQTRACAAALCLAHCSAAGSRSGVLHLKVTEEQGSEEAGVLQLGGIYTLLLERTLAVKAGFVYLWEW